MGRTVRRLRPVSIALYLCYPRRFRMVEFYYWREGSGGKSRLETVVLFLPDVWSAQASRIDWTTVQEQYKAAYEAALRRLDAAAAPVSGEAKLPAPAAPGGAPAPAPAPAADKSLIVCSQYCLVTFPTTCASKLRPCDVSFMQQWSSGYDPELPR